MTFLRHFARLLPMRSVSKFAVCFLAELHLNRLLRSGQVDLICPHGARLQSPWMIVHRRTDFRSFHPFHLSKEEKMNRFTTMVRHFVKNDEAATMVEYALMLSLIAVVCIAAVTLIGGNANNIFNTIAGALPGG